MNLKEQIQGLAEKFQKGGKKVTTNNIRGEYIPGIQNSVDYEKEYLDSPKFKERVEKAGYNFEEYQKKLKDSIERS